MNWSEIFKLNPRPEITLERVGNGKHKVVLVDGFYANPDQVLELARSLSYVSGVGSGNFPGGRAIVSVDTRALVSAVSERWGARLEPFETFHPVIFSALGDGLRLNVAQRQPHVDPGVTAMVYVNPEKECSGGTGRYRHRLTGLERIPMGLTPEIAQLAIQCGQNPKALETPQGFTAFQDSIIFNPLFSARDSYINDGNEFWELLYLIAMKPNRLVIFDGRMPHSQHMKDGQFRDHTRLNQILYLKPS
jgi:hypothetical protein